LFVLEAQSINAGYNDAVIVRDVTVRAKKGEIVTIVGPNGSGKSTLIKSLFGLARLFSGKILYQEQEITKATPWEAVDLGLGYVPQFNNVFINLTVVENLEMGAYLQDNRKIVKQDKEMIYQMFPELYARRKALAENLSGGKGRCWPLPGL
jgi:ABC-type branched-subunit amino acid transport system ATPase component